MKQLLKRPKFVKQSHNLHGNDSRMSVYARIQTYEACFPLKWLIPKSTTPPASSSWPNFGRMNRVCRLSSRFVVDVPRSVGSIISMYSDRRTMNRVISCAQFNLRFHRVVMSRYCHRMECKLIVDTSGNGDLNDGHAKNWFIKLKYHQNGISLTYSRKFHQTSGDLLIVFCALRRCQSAHWELLLSSSLFS